MRRANSRLKPLVIGILSLEIAFFWTLGFLGRFLFLEGRPLYAQFLIFGFSLTVGLYAFRAYDSERLSQRLPSFLSALQGMLFGGLLGTALLMTQFPRITRASFVQAYLLQLIFVVLVRLVSAPYFRPRKRRQGVFVIGDRRWESVMHEIGSGLGLDFDPLGFIPVDCFPRFCLTCRKRDHLVVVSDAALLGSDHFQSLIFSLGKKVEAVELLPNLAERALGRVPLSVAGEFKSHYEIALNRELSDPLQRLFDVALAILGLIVGAVFLLLSMVLVFLDGGLPVVVTREHVGLNGRLVRTHRLRITSFSHPGSHECASSKKMTRTGTFLKLIHLDALPLLWDVLCGRIALVGPSLLECESEEEFLQDIPFFRYREMARPGVTGLGKLKFPCLTGEEEARKAFEYDLYYLLRRSTFIDLQILLKTIGMLFSPMEKPPENGHRKEDPVILHLAKGYWPYIGGMETVVRQLSEGAVNKGYRVKVLCYGQEEEVVLINGVEVYRVRPSFRVGGAPIVLGYRSRFRQLVDQADILHFHCPNPMPELFATWLPQRTFKEKPVIATFHSDPLRPGWALPAYSLLLKAFLEKCHFLAATSPSYRLSSEFLKPHREYCRVIPLGADTSRFSEIPPDRVSQVEALMGTLGRPRVLFVGRLVYYKGVDVLLRAIAKVPELNGIIVGQGPLGAELKALARHLGVMDRVRFLGFLSDDLYPAVYRCADIFALPSVARTEAFGIVAVEAMAAGLPLVTTELSTGTSYHNRDGETGFVVPPGDINTLADRLSRLAADESLRLSFGLSGKERAREHFEEDSTLEAYLSLYGEAARKLPH
jgi:glycosyltransferase involved in cell wall biosynthesis/lipopolysaccharide/colanic/teichoic acid biosynthesis glycosyltransferase